MSGKDRDRLERHARAIGEASRPSEERTSQQQLDEARVYVHNLVAAHPQFGNDGWTVINVERQPAFKDMLLLDLDDGTTIRLIIKRFVRES